MDIIRFTNKTENLESNPQLSWLISFFQFSIFKIVLQNLFIRVPLLTHYCGPNLAKTNPVTPASAGENKLLRNAIFVVQVIDQKG